MVLTFVLVGLGVFVVIRPVHDLIMAPDWFFMVLAIGLGCLGCWWAGESAAWGPAAAGFAHIWYRLDQVLGHIRDWIKVASVTRTIRR
jgi:hypothetical protein